MELFLPIAHMDINIVQVLLYGAVVGFLSGLVGVGGGFLITPLLIFMGVPPIVAVSSGATQMAGTAAGASYIQWRYGNIDFKMALVLLAAAALFGVDALFTRSRSRGRPPATDGHSSPGTPYDGAAVGSSARVT